MGNRYTVRVVGGAVLVCLGALAVPLFRTPTPASPETATSPLPQPATKRTTVLAPTPQTVLEYSDAEKSVASGVTVDSILSTLYVYGNQRQVPDHNRFLWQTVAYLRAHPEACAELRAAFVDPAANHTRRALILDLLVGAGHETAQHLLVALLEDPVIADDPQRRWLVQRAALLDHPGAEAAAFAQREFARTTGDDHHAAAFVLGAAGGHSSDPAFRRTAIDTLTSELSRAEKPKEKSNLILALANTKDAQNTERFESFLRDGAEVRAAVANALADTPGPAARTMLVSLAADEDSWVQLNAVRSLRQTGDEGDLASLRALAEAGTLRDESLREYVRLASKASGADSEEVKRALHAVGERGDTNTRIQIAGMLRALGEVPSAEPSDSAP